MEIYGTKGQIVKLANVYLDIFVNCFVWTYNLFILQSNVKTSFCVMISMVCLNNLTTYKIFFFEQRRLIRYQ